MNTVRYVDENRNFENFEAVWQRVREEEEIPMPELPENRPEKLCIVKPSAKSCAVRFMAES